MVEELPWTQRLLGWIRAAVQEYITPFSHEQQINLAVQGLNSVGNQGALDALWASISDSVKTEPRVIAAHNAALALKLPRADTLSSEVEKLCDVSVDTVKKVYMAIEPVSVSDSYATAAAFVAADCAKDIAVELLGVATEVASAGQVDTVTDIFKFVRAKTGYGGVTTMLMKAPMEMSVMRPLSYYLHDTFRNELPPLWDIADMDVKGNLTNTGALTGFAAGIFGAGRAAATNKDIFDAVGGYEGYEQWYLDAKWDSRWRELRLGEIAWALSDSLVDDAQLDRMLGYAKYAPADRLIIIKFIKARYLRPYRDRVATQFRNEYKEGYISAQDFRLQLAKLEIPLPVRDLMISEADALFRLDMHADQIAAWEAQYLKTPSMTDAELRTLYSTIIVDAARIEPRIAKMRAQRQKIAVLPKPATQGAKVSSKPSWSMISLDFLDTGKLTPETIETSAGTHTLTVSAAGYEPYSEEFTVKEGEFVEIYAVLVPLPEAAE